jgi:hypothetical protein
MFDDCNTFFKGKPDGRDESRTGVPGTGANATPGAPAGGVATRPLRNSYTPPISAAPTSQSFARQPANESFARYLPRTILSFDDPPRKARVGPSLSAQKGGRRAVRSSLALAASVARATRGATPLAVSSQTRATEQASAARLDRRASALSTRPPQGSPKAAERAFPRKVSRERSDRTFARIPTSSRSSPRRTPSTRPAWRRASAGRSRTSRPCRGSLSRGSP